jgi:hypothetical protein
MSIVDLFLFTFGCTGLTVILVLSSALEPVRDFVSSKSASLGKLINCTMCSGFWVGLVAALLTGVNPVWGAAISSLFSWSISNIVESFFAIGVYFDSMLEEDGEEDERIVE